MPPAFAIPPACAMPPDRCGNGRLAEGPVVARRARGPLPRSGPGVQPPPFPPSPPSSPDRPAPWLLTSVCSPLERMSRRFGPRAARIITKASTATTTSGHVAKKNSKALCIRET